MATSNVAVDEGTADKRVATYSISEDAVTKEIQRVSVNNSSGAEATFNANGRAAAAASGPVVLSTEDLTEITAIKTAVQIIDNVVSGSEAQVDIVAALPAGTNNIGDVDVLSLVPGTGATALGKAIDTAAGATDTGVAALLVRDDALTTLTPVDTDYVPGRVNARGALWMAIEDGSGSQVTSFSGPTQYTEDAAAAGDPVGSMLMAIRRDTLSTSEVSADGDNVALKATNKGQLHVLAAIDGTQLSALSTTSAAMSAGYQLVGLPSDQVKIPIQGNTSHDGVDADKPLKVGHKAIAHGTNPIAVAASDVSDWYTNRAGVPWVIGGHPNVITRSHVIADGDGAQTDAALLTIGAGAKAVITQLSVKADASNTTNVAVKLGFGTATIPAASLAGTAAIVLEGQFAASGGHQIGNGAGIIAVGADNEDLRITCGDPVSGNLRVTYSYYTIES
jgi:hypothetical protein